MLVCVDAVVAVFGLVGFFLCRLIGSAADAYSLDQHRTIQRTSL